MNSTSVEHDLEKYIARCLLLEAANKTGGTFQNEHLRSNNQLHKQHQNPDQFIPIHKRNGNHVVEPPVDPEDLEPTKWPRLRRFKRSVRRVFGLFKSELGLTLVLMGYAGFGAWIFSTIEGPHEAKMEIDLDTAQRNYLKNILNVTGKTEELERFIECENYLQNKSSTDQWNETMFLPPLNENGTDYISEESVDYWGDYWGEEEEKEGPDWRQCGKLTRDLGIIIEAYYKDMLETKIYGHLNKGAMTWNYWGALFYCATIFTTVGYGNIVPITRWGRIATMIYALIGIPLCLVYLGKLGSTLTRVIKFFWGYGRRWYYTGSCARMRRMIPTSKLTLSFVQRIRTSMRRRRKSSIHMGDDMIIVAAEVEDMYIPTEIDDNFNLPPLFAISIAFAYILLGAFIYKRWEKNWDWLQAFYFTFISLSTVGFGDVIPEHPKFFLATSIYLLVGFALIAMVINVVMDSVHKTIAVAGEQLISLGQNIIPMNSEPSTPALMSSAEQLAEAKKASELRRNSL